MKFRQLNETLDYIMTGAIVGSKTAVLSDAPEDRLARAKKILPEDQTFLVFMNMATQPEQKIEGLKEGFPSKIKLERSIPDGIADTTARQEFRRIKSFLANGPYANVKPIQREAIWTTMLEGMHWREAVVLTDIKDQTLLEKHVGLDEVLNGLGLNVPITSRVVKKEKVTKDAPSPTTIAPAAKKAIQTKINISAAASKERVILATDLMVDTRPAVAPKKPLWLPTGAKKSLVAGSEGSLLDIALAEAAVAEEPSKKKTTAKKTVKKKTAPKKTAKKSAPLDDSVVTQEEFDEMAKLSEDLNAERDEMIEKLSKRKNIDDNVMEADILELVAKWPEHTSKLLKKLRDTQLERRKAKE